MSPIGGTTGGMAGGGGVGGVQGAQGHQGAQGGGSAQNGPVWLAPVAWIFLNQPVAGFTIPAYTYNNGAAGVGATVTETAATDGSLVIDSGVPTVGDRVLLADIVGSNTTDGIYTVTAVGDGVTVPWVLTRATDNDTVATLCQYWGTTVGTGATGTQFTEGSVGRVGYTTPGIGPVGTTIVALNIMDAESLALGSGNAVAINGGLASSAGAVASGTDSVALGAGAEATGGGAIAIGENAVASGTQSTAIGPGATSSVTVGTAIGTNATNNIAAGASTVVASVASAVDTHAGAYAMNGTEVIILATGAVTLPAPATHPYRSYTIKDNGGGTASVLPHAAETIDGHASIALSTAYEGVTVTTDGTNWYVTGQVAASIL